MKLAEFIADWTLKFEQAGISEPRLDAQLIVGFALNKSRSWVLANPEFCIEPETINPLLLRRFHREPLPYITGTRAFFGRDFVVNRDVLIPRQETETVVELCLRQAAKSVLDLGTGSGCIGITIQLENPDLRVTISDLSDPALEIAKQNARALGAKLTIVQSDLFENLGGQRFDLIVSNPPYIDLDCKLQSEIVDYEPHIALFAKNRGLHVYEQIAMQSPAHLNPAGAVVVEFGDHMAEDVRKLFSEHGFSRRESMSDLGGMERAAAFELARA